MDRSFHPDSQELRLGDKCLVKREDMWVRATIEGIRNSPQLEYKINFDRFKLKDCWLPRDHIRILKKTPKKKFSTQMKSLENTNWGELKQFYEYDEDELSHVENFDNTITKYIQLGEHEITTRYISPYPDEYGEVDYLYICEYCLKYISHERNYLDHVPVCRYRQPPGELIYSHNNLAIFEVEGSKNKLFCQYLTLLSKVFIKSKDTIFVVDTYLFYILYEVVDSNYRLVGYFSREMNPNDPWNLDYIMILPPYQRKGYGTLLIDFSYALSKIEGKLGGPRWPLSLDAIKTYFAYWRFHLISQIIEKGNSNISINEMCKNIGMTHTDMFTTIDSMFLEVYVQHSVLTPVNEAYLVFLKSIHSMPKLTIDTKVLEQYMLQKEEKKKLQT